MTGAKKRDWVRTLCLTPMTVWTVLFVGASIAYIIFLSFMKRDPAGFGVVYEFTLENYEKLANPSYLRVLVESVRLAAESTLLCLLIGYPFGYFMARAGKKWRTILMLLVMVPFWTNALVRVYGWQILLMSDGFINNILKALGLIERPLKLLNTRGAVLLGMTYALLPFMILPTYSSVEKMDWSLVEAGRDLGGKSSRVFLTITLPMTASGALAGVVLVFVPSISLFFISDLMGGGNYMLAGNLIYNQLYKSQDWPFAAALSVVLLVITCILLWLYRRAGGKASGFQLF